MKINRKELLRALQEAAPGVSPNPVLEQSDCLVLRGGEVLSFNDAIAVRAKSPLDFDATVKADDALKVLAKFPDDELDVSLKENEIRFKGDKRSAGLAILAETLLPVDKVPQADKWVKLPEGVRENLQSAAQVCGKDEAQYLTTVVHVAEERLEACDNYRLFRFTGATGFGREVLIPATQVSALSSFALTHVCVGDGWVFFKSENGSIFSVRCAHMAYHEGVDALLELEDGETVRLPANLDEILDRASVMNETGFDNLVEVNIGKEEMVVSSRKEGGWFRESKRIRYSGREIAFETNPKLLSDILKRAQTVEVSTKKMKVTGEQTQFVVALREPRKQQEE